MTITTSTREEWLNILGDSLVTDVLAPIAEREQLPMPPVRYSVGFARGVRGGGKHAVLGACHPRSHSTDGHNEIFISPECNDSMQIAETLVHELIHAFDDNKSGHKGKFATLARAAGLEGKLTATYAGDALRATLQEYLDALGDIPAAKMEPNARVKPKQSSRMIKVECSTCGFNFRASRTQIERITQNACLCCEATGAEGLAEAL